MHQEISHIRKTLKQIWPRQGAVVAGVSGGADSIALLYLIQEAIPSAFQQLCVAHIHHGIRGQAANQDQALVVRHCAALHIPCVVYHCHVPELARSWHQSLEEAARHVRLECWLDAAHLFQARAVILAHHQDDQAETLLLNLLRGSGSQGLAAMGLCRPFPHPQAPRDLFLLRPLLGISKACLVDYVRKRKLAWRQDQSNFDLHFTRNRIRYQLLPRLEKEFNPQVKALLAQSAENLCRDNDYLEKLAKRYAAQIILTGSDNGWRLSRRRLLTLPPSLQWRVLSRVWDGLKIPRKSSQHLTRLLTAVQCGHHGLSLPGHWQAFSDSENSVVLRQKSPKAAQLGASKEKGLGRPYLLQLPYQLEMHYVPKASKGYTQQQHRSVIYVDAAKVGKKLSLRTRKPGDVFRPLGMAGRSKELKKVFSEMKLLPEQRPQWPLLANAKEVLWIYRGPMSDRVKITPQTKKILKISLVKANGNTGLNSR